MITPRKVKYIAKRKEDENIRFRTFLKCNAEEKVLDQQFFDLHVEYFNNYDCSRCRNCCKEYNVTIPDDSLDKCASTLNLTKEDFVKQFLQRNEMSGEYETKSIPCDFLLEGGECQLGDCKPSSCKEFPYTNKPERLQSLYSVLDAVLICPIAFEIYEQLKQMYKFRSR